MPYRGGLLVDLAEPLDAGVHRFGRKATKEVGADLHKRVRRHTPVAAPGTSAIVASYPSSGAWIKARGGRRPGHLLESWETTEVVQMGGETRTYFRVSERTFDPIAPHVEYPTVPHKIRPRNPRGALTIPTTGGMILRGEVNHPGTQGSFMMAKALGEVAATWRGTVAAEWAKEARTVWRGAVS